MRTMAVAPSSSSLNPNAPLFIPSAYRRAEGFSPEWWELVRSTAWLREQQHLRIHEEPRQQHDRAAALPEDDDDLFYAPDHHLQQYHQPSSDADAVLRGLTTLASPRARGAPSWEQQQQPRRGDKPAQHVGVGVVDAAAARRFIHQPR